MSKTTLRLASLALAGFSTVAASSAMGVLLTADKNENDHWFDVNALVQFDQVWFIGSGDKTANYPDGSNIRRAFLNFDGGLGPDWSFRLGTDVSQANSTTAGSRINSAYLKFTGYENMHFRIGQDRPPLGMEAYTSGADLVFMERSLPTTVVVPNFYVGVFGGFDSDMLHVNAAAFHGKDKNTQARSGSEPLGLAARVTFVPVNTDKELWHFGASALHQDRHDTDGGTVTFSSVPELKARSTGTLSTGALANVKQYDVYGFEAAGYFRDVLLQGEYYRLHTDRTAANGGDLTFNGYYLQASYVLTGEKRPYNASRGSFGRVKPHSKDGAWEVAVRKSFMDLRDKSTGAPGSEHNYTAGVNWWANSNVSFAANFVYADVPRTNARSADIKGLGFRAQYVF